jgi:hypothetical protein
MLGEKNFITTIPDIGEKNGPNLFNLSAIPTGYDWNTASKCNSRPHIVLHAYWDEIYERNTFITEYIHLIKENCMWQESTDDMDAIDLLNQMGNDISANISQLHISKTT